jgi:arabinogalactan endo-1,4-beta-galactosidase
MQISQAFPSEYLKAADLQGRQVRVLMAHVELRDVGDDNKPVLFFQGKSKGVVLNKTNANNIALAYGDDTDGWVGHEVVLYEAMVDFQGRSVPAIRIRPPNAREKQPPAQSRPQPSQQRIDPDPMPAVNAVSPDPSDEIPF